MAASKAARSAATRSGGTPGLVTIGRATTTALEMKSNTACCSASLARSRNSGTSS